MPAYFSEVKAVSTITSYISLNGALVTQEPAAHLGILSKMGFRWPKVGRYLDIRVIVVPHLPEKLCAFFRS